MDKAALAVLIDARLPNKSVFTRGFYAVAARTDAEAADEALTALGANGYVVVSEPLLRELLAAASGAVRALNEDWYGGTRRRLSDAAAAVVEAVGPTREDTK